MFKFVSSSTFSAFLPNGLLLVNLKLVSDECEHKTISLVKISLKLFSHRLLHQKGAIFGFGSAASDETSNNVLKISSVDKETLSILDNNVQVHNIGKERNVGMINYKLSIRGKENLQAVSHEVVANKFMDLLQKNMSTYIKKLRKQAKLVEEIRVNWNEKLKELEAKGFEEKDLVYVKKDVSKLKDLEFLKSQDVLGPFTSAEDIEDSMEKVSESTAKNKRIYVEV